MKNSVKEEYRFMDNEIKIGEGELKKIKPMWMSWDRS